MEIDWTPHRFAGGVLALDVANTVVLRVDPGRTFDRLATRRELPRFANAAMRFRSDELSARPIAVEAGEAQRVAIIGLRESIDALFRNSVTSGALEEQRLADLLESCASALRPGGTGASNLLSAVAISAISLLPPERHARIRICDNCGWLFLDRSRNGSRRWCDMAVCGNRQKASRHYRRHRQGEG